MKHFTKQISWLLAFVLIFTSLASTGIPVHAADAITIGEGTDQIIQNGTSVGTSDGGIVYITYYESADSDTVLCEDYDKIVGADEIATQPYAWHVTFDKKVLNNSGTSNPDLYYFKAYPDASLENVLVSTPETPIAMTLPEGATLTTTGAAIFASIYVGDTLCGISETSSPMVLPSGSDLSSRLPDFASKLATKGYHLPDLTKLYYTVELTDKSTSPYKLKITLVPTAELTFDENTGTPDLSSEKKYATPKAKINTAEVPIVSKEGFDFYGWQKSDGKYIYLTNVTVFNKNKLRPISDNSAIELKAMYIEKNPTFKLDLANKKVINLLPNRTYVYPKYNTTWDYTTIVADTNGEFSYEALDSFESLAQLCLKSGNIATTLDSEFVSLKHPTPNMPVVEKTATTAYVTNTNDFAGCNFAVRATNDSSALVWVSSSTLSGLTPETEYKLYVKHKTDEDGFESNQAESVAFTTLAVKAVFNGSPNGVTIADIPVQTHTNSPIEPVLVIKDGDKTLFKNTDYLITYSNNINVGTATVNVIFCGDYIGTMTKNFDIVDYKLVSFDGNGGTGTMSDESVLNGAQYTLPACTFIPPANKEFKAWSIGGTEYAVGANYIMTDNTTVTAVWMDNVVPPVSYPAYTAPTITVIFNTDGGNTIDQKSIKVGSTIGDVPTPTKEGYVFEGWYSDKEITKAYDTNTKITATTTLYAKWTKAEPKPADNIKNNLVLTIGKKEAKAFGSDKTNDVAPIIRNGKPMLPARFVAESLGAKVTWNSKKQLVTIKGKDDVTILIYIGSKYAYVNGKKVKLSTPAFKKNGRVYTPLNFIPENLGASVKWNGAEREIVITK